jgi:hypothetical protein
MHLSEPTRNPRMFGWGGRRYSRNSRWDALGTDADLFNVSATANASPVWHSSHSPRIRRWRWRRTLPSLLRSRSLRRLAARLESIAGLEGVSAELKEHVEEAHALVAQAALNSRFPFGEARDAAARPPDVGEHGG